MQRSLPYPRPLVGTKLRALAASHPADFSVTDIMSLLRSAMTVGAATMLSRVLGFVRDILMAAMVGAGPVDPGFQACPKKAG
jgi:hypothetical protein